MKSYKQRCNKCKKNYVGVVGRQDYVLCYDCQKDLLNGEIKDLKMKKLFSIPEEYYKESLFLRNIKIYYLKFEKLSDKQIEAFKKVVNKLNERGSQDKK